MCLISSIASLTTPELERKIEMIANDWSIHINSKNASIIIESVRSNAEGIRKYQKFFSKKDSSSNSSSSSSQNELEHSMLVIDNHLY